ncbi:hypothetical protein ACJ41O_003426 [Fusarium nematophilum]
MKFSIVAIFAAAVSAQTCAPSSGLGPHSLMAQICNFAELIDKDGTIFHAYRLEHDDTPAWSNLDLNTCLGATDGKIAYVKDGNYAEACTECAVYQPMTDEEGYVDYAPPHMSCFCRNGERSVVNLNDVIGSQDGTLVC